MSTFLDAEDLYLDIEDVKGYESNLLHRYLILTNIFEVHELNGNSSIEHVKNIVMKWERENLIQLSLLSKHYDWFKQYYFHNGEVKLFTGFYQIFRTDTTYINFVTSNINSRDTSDINKAATLVLFITGLRFWLLALETEPIRERIQNAREILEMTNSALDCLLINKSERLAILEFSSKYISEQEIRI